MTDFVRDYGPKIHSNGGPSNPNTNTKNSSPSCALSDIESFDADIFYAALCLVELGRQEYRRKDHESLRIEVKKEQESCIRDVRVCESDNRSGASKTQMEDDSFTPHPVAIGSAREVDELTVGHDQENGNASSTIVKDATKRRKSRVGARVQYLKGKQEGKLRTYRTKRVKAKKNQRQSKVRETDSSGGTPNYVDSEDNYDALDEPVRSRNFKSLSALLGFK